MLSPISRRQLLIAGAAAATTAVLARSAFAADAPTTTTSPTTAQLVHPPKSTARYKIAAADWMMLKRQKPGALPLAHDCGLDGVEVDMGPLGKRPDFENELLKPEFLKSYVTSADQLGLSISSLALSAFYGQSFAKHASAVKFVQEAIDLLPKLGTNVIFIPVITRADLKKADEIADEPVQRSVIEVFRKIAPLAESAKAIIGISTQCDAACNIRLLDAIGSTGGAIRIAYNIGEAVDDGRDPLHELRTLGKDRIAEIVPTLSDGVWLEKDNDRLDCRKLKSLLDELDWSGWLILQRSRDKNKAKDVRYNFGANAKYLKSIFQA